MTPERPHRSRTLRKLERMLQRHIAELMAIDCDNDADAVAIRRAVAATVATLGNIQSQLLGGPPTPTHDDA